MDLLRTIDTLPFLPLIKRVKLKSLMQCSKGW